MAAGLLCDSPQPDGVACGHCRGCTQFAAGTHPNLLWITRELNDKGKEKRDIAIGQMRQMIERISLSSHYQQSWVVVIDPADALNISGVNAVLKTIEEPPAGCHVLLLSERPMELVPTLRSRCQLVRFPLPPRDAALEWLRAKDPKLDANALDVAGGAPMRALEDRESGLAGRVREWRRQLIELARTRLDPVAAASGAKLDKDNLAEWLRTFVGLLHDLLRARLGVSTDPALVEVAGRLTPGDVELLLGEAVAGHRRLQSNAVPQLLGESLMIALWARARSGAAPPSRNRA
jgi:DNA polymerase-3 subunit delta'